MGVLALLAGIILLICALMPWIPEDDVDELLKQRLRQQKERNP